MSNITLTIRLIRSFEHRNIKHIVYRDVDSSQQVGTFIDMINNDIPNRTELPPPFKKYKYDTLKISHKPFGFKTNDPVINTINDEILILKTGKSLADNGIVNETEISYFKMTDYEAYKKSLET
ncbi:UPF0538 protein C2orf76 homolog [Patella vulgata]|uniref:UPF0538 protein C2orf76 homolog n=1 Tax=Patella vulgata TaxID=6465 RepID=UPI00217F468A|nr:UPF0538 protein C2orf76 homolog [Patella vulgata]